MELFCDLAFCSFFFSFLFVDWLIVLLFCFAPPEAIENTPVIGRGLYEFRPLLGPVSTK